MHKLTPVVTFATLFFCIGSAGALEEAPQVAINEIFYHAPNDLDALQFIELHNPGKTAVNVGGWKFAKGIQYVFPAQTTIVAGGYLVLCQDLQLFKKHYGFDASGQFAGMLSRGGEAVELVDGEGKRIDGVKYQTRAPWPLAPDGYGASLERICPTEAGDGRENWAPSGLPNGPPRSGGTPGKKNANYAATLPPVVTNVTLTPPHPGPGQDVLVEADVGDGAELVELRYQVASSGSEKPEQVVPMVKAANGRYVARIPGQKAGQIIRCRVHAAGAAHGERYFPSAHDVRPALSCYVHDKLPMGKVPLGMIVNVGKAELRAAQGGGAGGGFGPPAPPPPPRGNSAFVYVNQQTGASELFDFVAVSPRSGGYKIRFHRDRPLNGMTTINLIHEYHDRFVLAEPLAYELYRRAGNAACRTDFVRLAVDGRALGYQLLVEQPNKSFLRHNKLDPDGDLYKCIWYGSGVVGQHEKHSNLHEGHDALVKLVGQLNRAKGDEQWEVIKKNIDVEQVATYFAVNMVLSHWDGYFNNYWVYHDRRGTGKWTMYPWDQDKTWGYHDGIEGYEVFHDMPVTFGMTGDVPPGFPRNRPAPQGFGFGTAWWRPAGHFSGPLLANPRFRKVFLAKTKDILEKVYTEEVFFPLIKQLQERLEGEVRVRAQAQGENPQHALDHFERNLQSLREHLTKRRKFLLAQPEIKNAGPVDPAEWR